jgi:hypothetical protein
MSGLDFGGGRGRYRSEFGLGEGISMFTRQDGDR